MKNILNKGNLLLVLGIMIGMAGYGQNNYPKISEQDYYDFYNSLVNQDSIQTFKLSIKPEIKTISDHSVLWNDSIAGVIKNPFSKEDIIFMKSQELLFKDFSWKKGKIFGAEMIKENDVHNEENLGYKNGVNFYSIPLFSIDRKLCLITKSFWCGMLCGYGCTYIYTKVNGKWIEYGEFYCYDA